jgi:hypothetical protein
MNNQMVKQAQLVGIDSRPNTNGASTAGITTKLVYATLKQTPR